jgi:uncharacterized protein DUF4397
MRLRRLGFVCAIGASLLAACGSNNLLGTTNVATQSAIRFINGSPNLGKVDVYINGTGSAASATALDYGIATTLSFVNSQSYTVTVTPAGNKATTSLACVTPSLGANTRYTVVIAGESGGTGNAVLQCQVFPETIYSLPAGSFQLALHNASPALGALFPSSGSPNGVGFGLFSITPNVFSTFAGGNTYATFTVPTPATTSGNGPVALGIAVNVLPGGVLTNPPGVGVYVSSPNTNPPTTPYATFLPSALQAGFSSATGACDAANTYPIQIPSPTPSPASTTAPTPSPTPSPAAGCATTSTVMSVYAIDGPTGGPVAKLVGVAD